MNIETIMSFMAQYGFMAIFVLVLLEYMNLPVLPGTVLLPVAGIITAKGGLNFPIALVVSVIAGLIGTCVIYILARLGGNAFLDWFKKNLPKKEEKLERIMEKLRVKGLAYAFVAKLIPTVRTLIAIPAGILRLNFAGYAIYSTAGIFVWNIVLMMAGFLLGEQALVMLGVER